MNVLIFGTQHQYKDEAIRVPVDVFTPSGILPCSAIIDTGAWMSFFDKAIAPLLGITDVTQGVSVPATAANGQQGEGFAFSVDIAVLRKRLTIPVAFVPSWPEGTPNLLGMRGFLDQLGCVAVDHSIKTFYY